MCNYEKYSRILASSLLFYFNVELKNRFIASMKISVLISIMGRPCPMRRGMFYHFRHSGYLFRPKKLIAVLDYGDGGLQSRIDAGRLLYLQVEHLVLEEIGRLYS